MAAVSVQAANPKPGDKVYYCNHSNGSQFWQETPCDAGMQLETGRVNDSGMIDSDASTPKFSIPTPAPQAVEASQAKASAASEDASVSEKETLKKAKISLLKFFGMGLLFAVVAMLTGRSFIRWFFCGLLAHFLLVALNIISM